MKEMSSNINYPTPLLNIELSRQAFKNPQLDLFSTENITKVNHTIEEILSLKEGENSNYYQVYLPIELEKKIPKNVRNKVSKEITAIEIRVLTAVVILAQLAKSRNELNNIEGLNRAFFELNINELYKIMGINDVRGKQRQIVKDALWSLNHKKYTLVKNNGKSIVFSHLVQVHEMNTEKSNVLKVTVEGLFFDFDNKKNNYFLVPLDINKKLKSISKGRPNAYVEKFIKCLYQAKHCSKNGKVEYSYSTIYDLMGLYKLKENRNGRLIQPTIEKAFNVAQKIGLVQSKEESKDRFGGIKYTIYFS